MSKLGSIIEQYQVNRQSFADDSQLYKHFAPDPSAAQAAIAKLEDCCSAVKSWMTKNMLKLNDDKTEIILLGPEARRNKVNIKEIRVCDSLIPLSESVRDLGLVLDSDLSMIAHINLLVKNCNYFLRLLGKLRPFLTDSAARSCALALIMSRLDYCNSTLWGLPAIQLNRLQKLQNSAARIVSKTKMSEHISPVLRDLHWLPVVKRIDHKVLSLTFASLNESATAYLQELAPSYTPPRSLRSASQSRLRLPSTEGTSRKKYGARSFSNAAPVLWNALPQKLRHAPSISSFRKQLKTHLFQL